MKIIISHISCQLYVEQVELLFKLCPAYLLHNLPQLFSFKILILLYLMLRYFVEFGNSDIDEGKSPKLWIKQKSTNTRQIAPKQMARYTM